MSMMRAPVFSRLWHCDWALRGLRLSCWHAELPLSCGRLLAVGPLPAELLHFSLQPAQLELLLLVLCSSTNWTRLRNLVVDLSVMLAALPTAWSTNF